MSAPTPGPWWAGSGPDRHRMRSVISEDGDHVAFCGGFPESEAIANARLIAAAPELLSLAKELHEALRANGFLCECGDTDCRTTRLRAAIAKATGEQA